ncbi:hypothetical protein SAMN02799631_01053 [Methylobacterium sp. 174MFSha1.1]|uniref:hypothetical protein n=1 Tax=Methylobacterium sp. 174MFSha1.1 TaxID=1502749 RepID=UPI0008E57BCE|nr:hypothetical protein [Methylobacterium sp. 174MFSha1.1]SFU53581.1 hypothetical protein SAMN02799631_01053 [Methylobacterium sp. 174MFSha1.1]
MNSDCYEYSQSEFLAASAERLWLQETFAELDAVMVEPAHRDVPAAPAPVVSDLPPEVLRMTLEHGRAWQQRFEEEKERKARERKRDRAEAERRREAKKEEARERTKARKRLEKRTQRERERAARVEAQRAARADVPAILARLDVPQVDEAQLAREAAVLETFLARPGRRQGALKGKNGATLNDLMETRRLYLAAFAIGNPGYGELAKLFSAKTGRSWSRDQARRRVQLFRQLEAPGSPWTCGDK